MLPHEPPAATAWQAMQLHFLQQLILALQATLTELTDNPLGNYFVNERHRTALWELIETLCYRHMTISRLTQRALAA